VRLSLYGKATQAMLEWKVISFLLTRCHLLRRLRSAITLGVARFFGVYTPSTSAAPGYMLFGKVRGCSPTRPPFSVKFGPSAAIINWFGKCHEIDMRLDQEYLRSQPVNSEEGAPMASASGTRCSSRTRFTSVQERRPKARCAQRVERSGALLSNMRLADMLETRHAMSQACAPRSLQVHRVGLQLGSVYIRKVHFRDAQMITRSKRRW